MKYLIFAALFTVSCALNVHFRDCGSPQGQINSVDISPCEHQPCHLKRNTTMTIKVNFTSHVDTTSVKTIVHGIIPGNFIHVLLSLINKDGEEGVRFLGVNEDACTNNNVDHCNIKRGEAIHYVNSIFVDPIYPLLRLDVKWEIRDETDKDLACIEIPAEIVN